MPADSELDGQVASEESQMVDAGSISEDPLTIPFNRDKLPPLPELPDDVAHIPFMHKSFVENAVGVPKPTTSRSEILSHKRSEHLGDAIIKTQVVMWLMTEHEIDSSVATRMESILLSNALLTRLAEGYGWKDMMQYGPGTAESLPACAKAKILADAFESYIGIAGVLVRKKRLPPTSLEDYFVALLRPEVFPTLKPLLGKWQNARQGRKQRAVDRGWVDGRKQKTRKAPGKVAPY